MQAKGPRLVNNSSGPDMVLSRNCSCEEHEANGETPSSQKGKAGTINVIKHLPNGSMVFWSLGIKGIVLICIIIRRKSLPRSWAEGPENKGQMGII